MDGPKGHGFGTVDVQIKAGKLVELYRESFQDRFSESPFINVTDATESARWMVTNIGYERSCALITAYFQIKDDWMEGQGYSLDWLKNNVNRVIVKAGLTDKKNLPIYVVSLSETGKPVCSYNRHEMGKTYWYRPMLWEEWEKATIQGKLQHPRETFTKDNVDLWVENWKEMGFLHV